MAGTGGAWDAVGNIGAAALSALGLILAGVMASRATASAGRTSREAQQVASGQTVADCEALVRALARAYDELRLWSRSPVGPPPEPNERVRRFLDTGA